MGLKNLSVILDFSCKDILQISQVNSSFNCFVVVWLVVRLLIFRRHCFICGCWVLSGRWEIKLLKFHDLSLFFIAFCDIWMRSLHLRMHGCFLWVSFCIHGPDNWYFYDICCAPLIQDSIIKTVLVDMLNRSGFGAVSYYSDHIHVIHFTFSIFCT